jgi:hypothetical protein
LKLGQVVEDPAELGVGHDRSLRLFPRFL